MALKATGKAITLMKTTKECFQISYRGTIKGDVKLQLSGRHNMQNALGAYALLNDRD